MIANTLLLPTEFPPHIDDIKRALLTYDRVFLYAPDDRDLMPSEMYNAAAFGMPVGFSGVPVRPLGKTAQYDEVFEEVLKACKPAVAQGSVEILPSAARPTDPSMKTAGLIIGSPPSPPNQVNPMYLLRYYRGLATNSRIITGIGRSLDALPPITDDNIERLAPKGIDDQQHTFQVLGVTPEVSLPAPSLYDGFAHTDEERFAFTRVCLARLAAFVRALGHCEILHLQPYITDTGYASVLQQLSANARDLIAEATAGQEDEEALAARLLSRLHNLVIAEFLDERVLREMSVSQVLKIRTRAWGVAGEKRDSLFVELQRQAHSCTAPESFDKQCRSLLEEYRRAKGKWSNEAAQLRVKFVADLGKIVLGGLTGGLGAEVAEKAVHVGTFEGLMLIGGMMFMVAAGQRGPDVLKALHELKERDRLPGCALARPYQPFLRP